MAQQYLEHPLRQPLHGLLQIAVILEGRTTDILHTDDGDGVVATVDEHMFVHQQMPPYLLFKIVQHRLIFRHVALTLVLAIFAIVVIAHDRQYAVGGTDLLQHMLEGNDLLGRDIDQVAREYDEVGMLIIDQRHEFINETTVAQIGTDVNIRQLQHAITVERRRQQR